MASLKQPAVGFNLGQSTGETSFEDDLPNYENWQANNPAPFLDLLDNIYDYLGFEVGTNGDGVRWVDPVYNSQANLRSGTDGDSGGDAGIMKTRLQRWLENGERRKAYKNVSESRIVRTSCGGAGHRANDVFDAVEYGANACSDDPIDRKHFDNGATFYGSKWGPSDGVSGDANKSTTLNYIFNLASNDGLCWDTVLKGAGGGTTTVYRQEDDNNAERKIFDLESVKNTINGTDETSHYIKRLITYLKMCEIAERHEFGKLRVSSNFSNYDNQVSHEELNGFMGRREVGSWSFTTGLDGRDRAVGLVAPFFMGQLEGKVQENTLENQNYPRHLEDSINAFVDLKNGKGRTEPQYTVEANADVYQGKSSYESFVDLLKVLIEDLIDNLDYEYYKSNSDAFDDYDYGGWTLETFATSQTFVSREIIEGIIVQIFAPNNPLDITSELRDWWYNFAALSGFDVPSLTNFALAEEKSALAVETVDLSCSLTCAVVERIPVFCPSAAPDPNAMAPVWTEQTDPFHNEKDATYSVTILTSFPEPEDAQLSPEEWETKRTEIAESQISVGIERLLNNYNKASNFHVETYLDSTQTSYATAFGEDEVDKKRDKLPVYSLLESYTGIPTASKDKLYYLRDSASRIINFAALGDPSEEGLNVYPYKQDSSLTTSTGECPNTSEIAVFSVNTRSLLLSTPDFAYISEYEIPGAPITRKMKVLVSIPSEIFDKIPEKSSGSDQVEEDELGPEYVVFQLIPAIKKASRNDDFRVMIRRVSTVLGHYAQQYAVYVQTNPENAVGYADLDLTKEAQYLREFKVAVNDLLLANGLNFRKVEKFRINFEDPESGLPPYTVKDFEIYDCNDKRTRLRSGLATFKRSPSVTRIRTMAYISRLPDMTNDAVSRETRPWQDFLEEYTYPFNLYFGSEDPQSALGCAFENVVDDPLSNLANGIANEIVSFPNAFAYAFNQRLCVENCDNAELENQLKEIDELIKRASRASFLDHFAGDSILQFLPELLAGNTDNIEELWSETFDKLKWCGLIYLLQSALECLQQGLNPDDIFRTLMRKALESLDAARLERLFVGLPPDKQQEVKAAIAGEFAGMPAPWEQGYRAGSYSGGGKKWSEYINQNGVETTPGGEFAAPTTGVGTIGNAADGALDAIGQAYVGAIWDVFSEDGLDSLYDILQGIPGGEILAKIIALGECAYPPLFNPPLTDFLKTLELDFCRGKYSITWPSPWPPTLPNFVDIWRVLRDVLFEVLQWLLIKIIMMIFKTIFDILFGLVCALLQATGALLNAALTQNTIQDAMRDTFCGLGASEESVNAAAAELLNVTTNLDPNCTPPTDADMAAFFEDVSVAITQDQLIDLLEGEDSLYIATIIYEMIQTQPARLGAFACIFPSPQAISDYFKSMGYLVPVEYKTRADSAETPLNIGLCGDPESILLQNEYQKALLISKGVPSESCDSLITGLRCKNLNTLEDLTNVLQNGFENFLPPIYASPGCDDASNAILPDLNTVDYVPTTAAKNVATRGTMAILARKHNQDLLVGHGFLNMVLSDRHGRGLRGHNNLIRFMNGVGSPFNFKNIYTDENLFPPTVAEHLRTILENYGDGGVTYGGAIESIDNFNLTRQKRTYSRKSFYDAEEEVFRPTLPEERKKYDLVLKYEDYKVGKEVSKNDAPYAFRLMYSHFVLDDDGVTPKFDGPIDYYGLRIEEDIWEEGDSSASSIGDWTNPLSPTTDVVLDSFGQGLIEGDVYTLMSSDTEEDISTREGMNLTSGREYEIGGLDIKAKVDTFKKDPHSVAFASLVRKRIEDNWQPGFASFGGLSPDEALDAFERMLRNQYYNLIVANCFNKSAYLLSKNSRAFTFGYDKNNDTPTLNFLEGDGITTFPETYGGTEKRPKFYLDPPKRSGWLGILDALIPPEDACPPDNQGLGLWDSIADVVEECRQKFIEDNRVTKDPACIIEKPFNRVFSKDSSATIEGAIISAIRIHAADALLKAVPNFSIIKLDMPRLYDDLLVEGITENILSDLLVYGERSKKKRRDYYYGFLEQVVQNYGKKIDAGMVELIPGSAEELAVTNLRELQETFMKMTATYPDGEIVEGDDGEPLTVGQHLRSYTSNPVDQAIKAALNGGSSSSALTNSIGKLRKREKFRMMYWRQFMDKPEVLENCRIILKKYVMDEMIRVGDQFANLLEVDKRGIPNFESVLFGSRPTYNLNPDEEDPDTEKPGNPGSLWMWGGLANSGHDSFLDGPWDVPPHATTTLPAGSKGWNKDRYEASYYGNLAFNLADDVHSEVNEYFRTKKYYNPFMLERYVTIKLKRAVVDADGIAPPGSISEKIIEIKNNIISNTDANPASEIVMNIVELTSIIDRNPHIYDGVSPSDVFEKFEFGMRIVFVPGFELFIDGVTGQNDRQLLLKIAKNYSDSMRLNNRAYWTGQGQGMSGTAGFDSVKFAIPLVSAQTEITATNLLTWARTNTTTWLGGYLNYQDCLIADLSEKTEYKLLFNYCFPFARFNSIFATYNMYAFLPSIGAPDEKYKKIGYIFGPSPKDKTTDYLDALDDEDMTDEDEFFEGAPPSNAGDVGGIGTGNDGWMAKPTEAGGGKHITFTPGFRSWDKTTFKRSKKFARVMFNMSYKGSDSEFEEDPFGTRNRGKPTSNLDLGLGWIFNRRRVPKPPEEC